MAQASQHAAWDLPQPQHPAAAIVQATGLDAFPQRFGLIGDLGQTLNSSSTLRHLIDAEPPVRSCTAAPPVFRPQRSHLQCCLFQRSQVLLATLPLADRTLFVACMSSGLRLFSRSVLSRRSGMFALQGSAEEERAAQLVPTHST